MSSEEVSAISEGEQSSTSGRSYSPSGDISVAIAYDTSAEPLATPEEHAEYERVRALEKQEQQQLSARFSGEQSIDLWCNCSNCSLEFVVKPEECRCCFETDHCRQKMAEENLNDSLEFVMKMLI